MQAQPLSKTAAKTPILSRFFLLPVLLSPELSSCIAGEGLC